MPSTSWLVAVLTSGLVLVAAPSTMAMPAREASTPSLCEEGIDSGLRQRSARWLDRGIRLTVLERAGSLTGGQDRALRLSILELAPGAAHLRAEAAPLPERLPPAEAFDRRAAVALVNGGLFDMYADDASVPTAPVVSSGEVVYAPPGEARVVAWSGTRTRTSLTRLDGTITLLRPEGGELELVLAAVNDYRLDRGAVLFTNRWSGRTPRGEVTLVLEGGRVTRVDSPGRPRPVLPGQQVVQLPASAIAGGSPLGARASVDLRLTGLRRADRGGPSHVAGHNGRILGDGLPTIACTLANGSARPRTALAWDDNGRRWLVVASSGLPDGPSGPRMGGVAVPALARWLSRLGATDAVLLDGGGSTIMLARDRTGALRRVDLPETAWPRPLPVALSVEGVDPPQPR